MKNIKNYTKLFSIAYLGVLLLWYMASRSELYDYQGLNYNVTQYHFFPYISMFIGAVVDVWYHWIQEILTIILIPFGTFYLLLKIYQKHVSASWSIFFTLLSISVFEDFPFRAFLTGAGMSPFDMPLVIQFPFPGLSTLLFLGVYVLISSIKKLTLQQVYMYTVVCGLFFYVNALESLFLLGFWFLFFGSRLAKKYGVSSTKFIGTVALQIVIVVGIVMYGLSNGEIMSHSNMLYGQYAYHIIAYYVLPIVLMAALYLIKRIDPYEIWFKFRHIYGFMAIEIGIVLLSDLSLIPISTDILNSRISQFFLHLFYYVPVIYYLSRPYQEYHKGIEAKPLLTQLRKLLNKFYPRFEQIFTFIISLLLIIYNIYPLILQWTA